MGVKETGTISLLETRKIFTKSFVQSGYVRGFCNLLGVGIRNGRGMGQKCFPLVSCWSE